MQLLFFGAIIVGGWYLYHKFVSDAQKLTRKNKADAKKRENNAQGTLVLDPETGEYRVKKDEES